MKRIYLIRHAESEDNSFNLESRDDTVLSEKGRQQAEHLSKRFTSIDVDKIISSSFKRTMQTVEAISAIKNIRVEISDLFAERKVPSEILGKSFDSAELQNVYKTLRENYFISEARHSDEETFEDIKIRARKALVYLEENNAEHIVIACHGMFIVMLISYITFGESVGPRDFVNMFNTFKISNTGITLCEYDQKNKTEEITGWRLITWNDQIHLN